jgi:galactosamine-6-phosphate isomerase
MNLLRHDNHEALSRDAADFIHEALSLKPDLLLCTATGATPTRTYQLLIERYLVAPRTFDSLRVLKLDEWIGLRMAEEGSCEHYLQTHLIHPLQVTPDRYAGFDAAASDRSAECARITEWLAAHGPIDLCVLGIGTNGHIALNEPAPALDPHIHVATLAETTRRHSMFAAVRSAPTHGYTLGMAEIMSASRILLLISGVTKRAALQRLLSRVVTTEFPASLLWLHPNCTVLFDADAG